MFNIKHLKFLDTTGQYLEAVQKPHSLYAVSNLQNNRILMRKWNMIHHIGEYVFWKKTVNRCSYFYQV